MVHNIEINLIPALHIWTPIRQDTLACVNHQIIKNWYIPHHRRIKMRSTIVVEPYLPIRSDFPGTSLAPLIIPQSVCIYKYNRCNNNHSTFIKYTVEAIDVRQFKSLKCIIRSISIIVLLWLAVKSNFWMHALKHIQTLNKGLDLTNVGIDKHTGRIHWIRQNQYLFGFLDATPLNISPSQ